MASNLAAVRAALKVALDVLDDINVSSIAVSRPQLPAAIVGLPVNVDPRIQFGDVGWKYGIPIDLLVGAGDDASSDAALETLLSEDGYGSAVVALRADDTLGGACQYAEVVGIGNFRWVEFGDGNVVAKACTITVEVQT